MSDKPVSVVPLLARALHRIRSTPPRIIASPPTQPRRAAVAIVIRVVPPPDANLPSTSTAPPALSEFFQLDWVNNPNARAEVLFLQRDNPISDDGSVAKANPRAKEAHVAFPGGRTDPDDEGGAYTGVYYIVSESFVSRLIALRQTWEEIGIDLAERDYMCIGQLDDREITTSLGKRLLMILSPFVFLQVSPRAPPPDPVPSTTLHWIPLASLVSANPAPRWSTVTVDAASRLAPKHSTALRLLVRILIGSMEFPAIVLENKSTAHVLKLWGLSLGMTLDLMSYMVLPTPSSKSEVDPEINIDSGRSSPLSPVMYLPYQSEVPGMRMEVVAPSLASVFPRFSYPDVNFWIW